MKMGSKLSPQGLEGLRQYLRPDVADMPAEDLEQIVDSSISEMPAGIAEDFMKTLNSLVSAAGPTLQRATPGIAQGALTGASVGGPWGALIGAGAGLASSALGAQARPPKRAAPAPAVTVPPSATGPAAPALPTGQAAAATVLGLLQNPTVQQALTSQALGADGKQQVPTASGANLPRGAINSLLTQLLANATEGLVESESISEQSYLQGESGEYLIDPASPEQQAAVVLSHLQSGAAQFPSDSGEFVETVGWMREESADTESGEWQEFEESAEMVWFY
jgi:hypothetical protein